MYPTLLQATLRIKYCRWQKNGSKDLAIGINIDGKKDVPVMWEDENESVKFGATADYTAAAGISSVDWKIVVSAPLLAGLLSVHTFVACLPEVREEYGRQKLRLSQDLKPYGRCFIISV